MANDKDWSKVAGQLEVENDLNPNVAGLDAPKARELLERDAEARHIASSEPLNLLEHPDYVKLQELLFKTEQERDEFKNAVLLAKADMENARRRFERDLTSAHAYANSKLVQELLPILDSLDRGLALEAQDPASEVLYKQMHAGMEMTANMLLKVLQKYGVAVINPVAYEPFNPAYHEAMSVELKPEVGPNSILKVLQKGYLLKDRVIRAALVVVSKTE